MNRMLLLGDEAAARGAIDSGISTAYAYPGTPSSEIFEYIQRYTKNTPDVHATWAANEKVAYEECMGTSLVGRRSAVVMKHVGLNVAADPLMSSTITGVKGGVVVMVADDPGMHSSQNEQDSRYYADFALMPCYEPANQQEAYDMCRAAFDTSEKFRLPVLLRLVTRLAHSRADVDVRPGRKQNALDSAVDRHRWTLLPTVSRMLYAQLLDTYERIRKFTEASEWNELVLNPGKRDIGIITAGVGYNYFREVAGVDPPSHLKIGLYPLPVGKVRKLMEHCGKVLIVEEGYPFIERTLVGVLGLNADRRFMGKHTGHLPITGELNPDHVAKALGAEIEPASPSALVRPRPPQLCRGCPHVDLFRAVNEIRNRCSQAIVTSDIGCYTLGFYPPYNAIDSTLEMGASIGMAKGAVDAGHRPVLSVIGDSTFGHSGITGLLTAAHENTDMTLIILDNSTTAMTGYQETFSSGDRLVEICMGVGVPAAHVRVITPLPANHRENVGIIQEEVDYEGLSVIISDRPCIQIIK